MDISIGIFPCNNKYHFVMIYKLHISAVNIIFYNYVKRRSQLAERSIEHNTNCELNILPLNNLSH